LRSIRLLHVNLVLYAALVVAGFSYRSDLRWALKALPSYLDGSIASPVETVFYVRARRMLEERHVDLAPAERLLRASLAIDPNTEAGYWLAELYARVGREREALERFEAYLEIDPTRVETYLRIADLLERKNQDDRAREVLRKGIDYFESRVDRYVPRPDDRVDDDYNRKAVLTHESYARSARLLRDRLAR